MNEVNIQFIDFPSKKTKECVTENADGSYTIFIEASLSSIEAEKVYQHAMKHINNNDFEYAKDVDLIENNAHS